MVIQFTRTARQLRQRHRREPMNLQPARAPIPGAQTPLCQKIDWLERNMPHVIVSLHRLVEEVLRNERGRGHAS